MAKSTVTFGSGKQISFDNCRQTVDTKNLNPLNPGRFELSIVYFSEKLDKKKDSSDADGTNLIPDSYSWVIDSYLADLRNLKIGFNSEGK